MRAAGSSTPAPAAWRTGACSRSSAPPTRASTSPARPSGSTTSPTCSGPACRTAQYDSIFCAQVLHHLPEPELALREIARMLKPGGKAILSVPHLVWLHNEPHDYWRFTGHGLRHLVEKAGLRLVSVEPVGGLICFLAYAPSTAALALLWPVRPAFRAGTLDQPALHPAGVARGPMARGEIALPDQLRRRRGETLTPQSLGAARLLQGRAEADMLSRGVQRRGWRSDAEPR